MVGCRALRGGFVRGWEFYVAGGVSGGNWGARVLKLIAYPLAVLLGLLGIVFVVGAQGQWLRVVIGVVLLAAGGAMV